MKKRYITPMMKVVAIDPSEIICASVGFGDGTTDTMNARDFDFDNGLDDIDLGNSLDDLSRGE